MRWIFVLCLCGCSSLYPQTRPRCEEVCQNLVSIDSQDVFVSGSSVEYCTLKCEDEYGIFKAMDFKRCLRDAGNKSEVEGCQAQLRKEKERMESIRVFRKVR